MVSNLVFVLMVMMQSGETAAWARFDTRIECESHAENLRHTLRGRASVSCVPTTVSP